MICFLKKLNIWLVGHKFEAGIFFNIAILLIVIINGAFLMNLYKNISDLCVKIIAQKSLLLPLNYVSFLSL